MVRREEGQALFECRSGDRRRKEMRQSQVEGNDPAEWGWTFIVFLTSQFAEHKALSSNLSHLTHGGLQAKV